ncbi:MAG: WD40 repeat domain-containing protein [Verrucomicrobiales bacterium]|nr:WD40 repeat domain-containing protein [Verrucomicrobiales bacterium]
MDLVSTDNEHTKSIVSSAFSDDGNRLLTVCKGRKIIERDTQTGKIINSHVKESDGFASLTAVLDVCYRDDKPIALSDSSDQLVVYNPFTGENTFSGQKKVFSLKGVTQGALSRCGNRLALLDSGSIKVFDLDGEQQREFIVLSHLEWLKSVSNSDIFIAAGQAAGWALVAVSAENGEMVKIRNPNLRGKGFFSRLFGALPTSTWAFAEAGQGKLGCLSVCGKQTMKLFTVSLSDGEITDELVFPSRYLNAKQLCITKDNRIFAIAARFNGVKEENVLIDLPGSQTDLLTQTLCDKGTDFLSASPDSSILVIGSKSGKLSIYSLKGSEEGEDKQVTTARSEASTSHESPQIELAKPFPAPLSGGLKRGDRVATIAAIDMNTLILPEGTVGVVANVHNDSASCYFDGFDGLFGTSVGTLKPYEAGSPIPKTDGNREYDLDKAVSTLATGWIRPDEWVEISNVPSDVRNKLAAGLFEELAKERYRSNTDWHTMPATQYLGKGIALTGPDSIGRVVQIGDANLDSPSHCIWAARVLGEIVRSTSPNELTPGAAKEGVAFLIRVIRSGTPTDQQVWSAVEAIGEFRVHAQEAIEVVSQAASQINRNIDRRLWEIYDRALAKIGE